MKQKMKTKHIWSLMLILAMAMAMMLGMTVTANADATNYNVWVGGTQVTSLNANDVFGDGTVSYTPATTGDNPTPATLTLNGYSYEGEGYLFNEGSYADYAAIYAEDDLTIILVGTNTVTNTMPSDSDTNGYGICTAGDLTIDGEGTLNASASFIGIYVDNLQIDSGTVNATGKESYVGIDANNNVIINDGTVNTTGDWYGIYAYAGDITINGGNISADTTDEDSDGIYTYEGDVTINGGNVTVTATEDESDGIHSGGDVTIEGGTVNVAGNYNGIVSYGEKITINGGTVNATAEYDAICSAKGEVSITGGTVTAIGENKKEGHGICGTETTIGKDVTSVIASGSEYAVAVIEKVGQKESYSPGIVKNAIPGTGWTDVKGKTGRAVIDVSSEGQTLDNYKRVQFPEAPVYAFVWVGDTQVSNLNADDILGDGTASYDAETKTLTLNNCNYEGKGHLWKTGSGWLTTKWSAAIYADQDLTIKFKGTNTIIDTCSDLSRSICSVYTNGALTIDGDGTLNLSQSEIWAGHSIYTENGDLVINNGTINAQGQFAIVAYQDFYINGGNVTVSRATRTGIYVYEGDFVISDATVNCSGDLRGIDVLDGNIEIKDGRVTATANEYTAVAAKNNISIISGTLKATSHGNYEESYGFSDISYGVSASDVTIGSGITSFVSTGKVGAFSQNANVKNAIAGTGWTDIEGTQEETKIDVSSEGQKLSEYKKVQFIDLDVIKSLFDKIPDDSVTEEDEAAVEAAREAFDLLTDAQKDEIKLSQLKKLRNAENAIEANNVRTLVMNLPEDPAEAEAEKAQAVYSAYMALTDEQKASIDDIVNERVAAYKAFYEAPYIVSAMMTKLPYDPAEATGDDAKAAYRAYTALTEAQKALIGEAVQQKIEVYGEFFGTAYNVIAMVKSLPENPADADADEAWAAYGAYMLLSDAQKALFDPDTQNKVAAYKTFFENKYAAKNVNDLVTALPDDPAKADATAAQAAYGAYMLLSDEQKALLDPDVQKKVEAYKTFYETKYANQAAAAKVSAMVNNLPYYPAKASQAEAKAAFGAYMALTADQKALLGKEVQQKVAAYKYYYEAKYAKAPKMKLKSVKAKKGKKAVVKWNAVSGVSGYQIYYKAKGKKGKKVIVSGEKAVKKTVKKLKAGKKYTFKVRTVTEVYNPATGKKENVYGKWSKAKKVKAKK